MDLESVPCYLCGDTQQDPWGMEKGYAIGKCRRCGLVYLNPRPVLEQITEAARTGLHETESNNLVTIGKYSTERVNRYRTRLQSLFSENELTEKPCRWLDIGAGFGELLQALREISAKDSVLLGIEPCEPKVNVAKSLGLPVENRLLKDVAGTFTHISLVNVFSHLPDPIDFLNELKPLMAPNCKMLLVTGNGGDLPRKEYPGILSLPDHLSFAGEANLHVIFEKAGFQVKKIDRYPHPGIKDTPVVGFAKNIVRRLLGRETVPLRVPKNSRFRSLWILAEQGAGS